MATINFKKIKPIHQKEIKDAENFHSKYYEESDDSDDEKILSKIGRLQSHKYKDKDFIGYDENLQKIKKKKNFDDKIEEFIQKSENKDWWRIVRDELNNQDLKLSDKQLNLLDRLRSGKAAVKLTDNYYFDNEDFNQFDLISSYLPKRRFLPSKNERIKINKLVQAIKLGRIKLNPEPKQIDRVYDIWQKTEEETPINKYLPQRIPAPKMDLPGNVYSYNPPQEYLFTPEEREAWLQADPEDREIPLEPQSYRYLRHVPSTPVLSQSLFQRCLDLYLCPRVRRKKLMMKSSDFLPEIQNPEELKPFPTHLNLDYAHDELKQSGGVVGLSVSQENLIVCYKKCLAIYDIKTTKCFKLIWADEDEEFNGVDYNDIGLIGLVKSGSVQIICDKQLEIIEQGSSQSVKSQIGEWQFVKSEDESFIETVKIKLEINPTHINFHAKGDYFVTTQPLSQKKSHSILVHCLSKAQTSQPFQNMKATTEVQQTLFHPSQPHLIIMTKKHVFIYSLSKQQLIKKLLTGNQWNSSVAIHPYGDNILLGSHDHKVCWFDLDMGSTPFKKMSYHEKAVRKVCYHKKYPLFGTCSDDGTLHIFHGRVSTVDLSQPPFILPLKILKLGKKKEENALIDIQFHPSQPWIFSANGAGQVHLWT